MSRRQELDYAIAESIEASKMPLEEPSVFQGDLLKYNRWAKSFDAFISKRNGQQPVLSFSTWKSILMVMLES
jgi:hypothetical protein